VHETLHFVEHHGYWLLAAGVVGRQAFLPVPTSLLLLAAGALAHGGKLNVAAILMVSVVTFLLADLAWYQAGRRTGERILHFLCGLSSNPEACVVRATSSYDKHGVRVLLFSKFIMGLDGVSVPLAGAARTPLSQFLAFDAIGALTWSASYVVLGYAFSSQVDRVGEFIAQAGTYITIASVGIAAFFAGRKLTHWLAFLRQFRLSRITPDQLRDKLQSGEDLLLVDLQRHGKRSGEAMAIPGAVRINPDELESYRDIKIPPRREIVLYCAAPGEFTSARVAMALQRNGIERVRPLAGGLRAWRERGFPVTAEVRLAHAHGEVG
jgi:membrane protein DedA with SNARE-associated domain/rhodanese-related sulfurtransferase